MGGKLGEIGGQPGESHIDSTGSRPRTARFGGCRYHRSDWWPVFGRFPRAGTSRRPIHSRFILTCTDRSRLKNFTSA